MNNEIIAPDDDQSFLFFIVFSIFMSVILPFALMLAPGLFLEGPLIMSLLILTTMVPGLFITLSDIRYFMTNIFMCVYAMVSRREIEEKRRKDEMEAAYVFEEFIETFQSTSKKSVSKTWIKAGIINPDKVETSEVNTSTLYKPLPRFKTNDDKTAVEQAQECARILQLDRKHEKKKSNLESFKEELELIHKDREERQKIKEELKFIVKPEIGVLHSEQGEPNSTNLYVNNLNSKITEFDLMRLFGKYGPLASVKIMWPRSEEERSRNKNCGFVAYMGRKDAERALKHTNNLLVMDCELKVGWGKPVLLPSHPIYIPPPLLELSQPPPASGLPFNAQLLSTTLTIDTNEEYLQQTVVKVVIPTDRTLLALIHRMVEFVVREGVLFEAVMMTRELNNPAFRFLFDNQCPAHIYYRWKLYSIAHGDNVKDWSTREFRMFNGGSIWKPPIIPNYTQGMPEELFDNEEKQLEKLKKTLSNVQRDNLEYIIHKLTPQKSSIAEAMIFCINHIDAYEEIAECLAQSLERVTLPIKKIIARLYLITDILYNSKSKPDTFRKIFEIHLPGIMKLMCTIYEQLINQEKQTFFVKIIKIFNGLSYWNIFSHIFIHDLYQMFINKKPDNQPILSANPEKIDTDLQKEIPKKSLEVKPTSADAKILPGFIPSRWEIVDPDIVESQAMTTSKWTQLDDTSCSSSHYSTKSKSLSEDRRKKLREIEVKVLEFEDKLESDNIRNISEKVENYRRKLIKLYEEKMEEEKKVYKRRKIDKDSPKRRRKNY